MGKKRSASGGGSGRPNWTPYAAAVGVVVVALALYSFFYPIPEKNGGGASDDQPKAGPRGTKSTPELENEIQRLHAGLASVAGRTDGEGGTGVFKKIRAMAAMAEDALANAAAASTEAERREIYLGVLRSKEEWLMALGNHAEGLQKEQEEAEKSPDAPLKLEAGGSVTPLSFDSFSGFLADNPHAMVEFYAPWCGHCKKFAPEYEKSASRFKGQAGFGAVDGTIEQQLARIYSIQGYPTLKWFVRGQALDYEGPRTLEKLSSWVEEHLLPAYTDVNAVDEVISALEGVRGEGRAMVCSGEGTKGSAVYNAFAWAAEIYRSQIVFTWVDAPSPDGVEAIKLYRAKRTPIPCPDIESVVKWLADQLDVDEDFID